MGRDHTLFALTTGTVQFSTKAPGAASWRISFP
jgi:ribosomal protein L27